MPPVVEIGQWTINYAAGKSINIGRLLHDREEYVKVHKFATMKCASKFTGNMIVKIENGCWRSGKFHLWRQLGKDLGIDM